MYKNTNSFFSDLLLSGHSFESNEVLLKFQYHVLNTVLLVMGVFTFIFAFLSTLDINPLGTIQTGMNYFLVLSSILLITRLRGSKDRYYKCAYIMYAVAYISFVSALLTVPHDEFRIIWFYLLVFAAYITGGVRAGNIISIISIATVLAASLFHDLELSQTAIVSAILGLIIASFFIRAYTKKIADFEKEIIEQERFMVTQSRFAAMGEMMSMIAHQWRQPLSTTTLMIANEKIKLMVSGKEPSEYDEMLDKISETIVYLSDTIDDFQTYFKPNKGFEEIAVSTIIERTLQLNDSRLKLAAVKIHVEDLDAQVIETYVNEVIQVLINIINNAVDILSKRETGDRDIWIRINSDKDNIIISIEDNAGGIEEAIIDKIFEPYFSSKSKNGTGLGLYMAKMIIDQHINGKLSVVNSSKGACFTIVLPKKLSFDN